MAQAKAVVNRVMTPGFIATEQTRYAEHSQFASVTSLHTAKDIERQCHISLEAYLCRIDKLDKDIRMKLEVISKLLKEGVIWKTSDKRYSI